MELIGTIDMSELQLSYPAVRYCADGTVEPVEDAMQEESLLQVFVNDELTMQLGCSSSHLAELVVGRLFTEGIVSSLDEVGCLSICEHAMKADVYLIDRSVDRSRVCKRIVPTCCTNNIMLNDFFDVDDPLTPVRPIAWDASWVFRMAHEFAEDKTAHARTRGVHSAYLSTPLETLVVREDIGRHNAFDKAIGWALINGVDLTGCMLFTSGRVPTDMVTKAIRAGIPVLASKAVATDKTVEIARQFDLTLICAASPESFDVLSSPEW